MSPQVDILDGPQEPQEPDSLDGPQVAHEPQVADGPQVAEESQEPHERHEPGEPHEPHDRQGNAAIPARLAPLLAVAAAVAWSAFQWRSELRPVAYLNDSSVHEQMVRSATQLIGSGHLPLTSWFPYLGLGSPQFLHYQSLGAMLTGVLGLLLGGDAAFRWSLYVLLVSWPIPVYYSARLFNLSRPMAALAAVASPLIISTTLVGYEPGAYIWVGYGLWSQMWGMWALPLAWGFTWRAMSSRRYVLPAVALVALTVALHFETGYLALIPIVAFPFVCPSDLRRRLARAGVVAVGALAASAWVTVPLLLNSSWAATNEILAGSALENGYGAGRVVRWLLAGQVFDASRIPVISVFAGIGLVACLLRWRSHPEVRAILVVFAMSLVLSFGRPTFGPLTSILPGSKDLFLRRFMMGAQLAGLYLAGIGAVAAARLVVVRGARLWSGMGTPGVGTPGVGTPGVGTPGVGTPGVVGGASSRASGRWRALRGPEVLVALGVVAVVIVVLAPAWMQVGTYASHNSANISYQSAADTVDGAQIGQLVTYMRVHGGGRVYAGMPSNWGESFLVGDVPVFKYLESEDVDEVGYTLRTASLMTDPEYYFDEDNVGDYGLFGIHYLILPAGSSLPVVARPVMTVGSYTLWVLPTAGYVQVVDTVGTISADRANVGNKSIAYLRSPLPGRGQYLSVAYDGAKAPPPTVAPSTKAVGPPGQVVTESDHLSRGEVAATVSTSRTAVIVLSASFDPGWRVRIDDHLARTQMVAPALVAVEVPPGHHRIVFTYQGFGYYPELAALALLTVLVLGWLSLGRLGRLRRLGRLGRLGQRSS